MSKEIHGNSLYKEEYCEKIVEFFNIEPFEPVMMYDDNGNEVPMLNKSGQPVLKPNRLPTVEGFAKSIGVAPSTVRLWATKEESFSESLTYAKELARDILVQNGLLKLYDPTITKFVGVNYFGKHLRDKQEVEQTGNAQQVVYIDADTKQKTDNHIDEMIGDATK